MNVRSFFPLVIHLITAYGSTKIDSHIFYITMVTTLLKYITGCNAFWNALDCEEGKPEMVAYPSLIMNEFIF